LKFNIGNEEFSIDVDRNQLEQLKDIYKALIKISHIVEENSILLEKSQQTLNLAAQACGSQRIEQGDLEKVFVNINEYSFNWISQSRQTYIQKDFSDVFKNYINN